MTTTPTKTVREIRALIAFCSEAIDGLDGRRHALLSGPDRPTDYVVGFKQYSLYVGPSGTIGGLHQARLYGSLTAARAVRVVNGRGETASPIPYEVAVDTELAQLEQAHALFCRNFQDMHVQLVEAQEYEDHLDACAEQERVLADYRLDQRL